MAALIITFAVLFLATFAGLALATRPTKEEKAIAARVAEIAPPAKAEDSANAAVVLKNAGDQARFSWMRVGILGRVHGRLQKLLQHADSGKSAENVMLQCGGLFVAGFAISKFSQLPQLVCVIAALVASILPILLLRFQSARRLKAFNEALPDAMDLMARALRAGHSVSSAIEVVAEQGQKPVSTEFARVYQEQNFGLPFRDSLIHMADRIASKDLQFVITAMLVQKETGGNLTEILDRTTEVIRERLRIHGEVRVKTAQGRLTGWILSLLPIGLGALINCVNPGFEKPLFEDELGKMMLYAGAGMLVVGMAIIRKIVDIEV